MTVDSGTPQFRLQRINPFQGLMIDSGVWQDAHNYHRDALRLHQLALHGWGIVQGLEVSPGGPEGALVIQPGIAVDQAGSFVVVTEPTMYRLTQRSEGLTYLVLLFREVLGGPTQTGIEDVGTPTRIIEAYHIQERDRLPSEPHIELARVDYDPDRGHVVAPADPEKPGPNELDLRYRVVLGTAQATGTPAAQLQVSVASAPEAIAPRPRITATRGVLPATAGAASGVISVALGLHSGEGADVHREGLRLLAREVEASSGQAVRVFLGLDPVEADRVDFLYLGGYAGFTLSESELSGVGRLLERGGVVVGEGCAFGPTGDSGAREFALAFADLANNLGHRLAEVSRGHRVMSARHLFAKLPAGCRERTQVVEADGMVYSDADYGCAWSGGSDDNPLARSEIRDALEFGVNLALYRRS